MSSTTTNLGLYKPAAGENVSVTTDLNNNWDSIDALFQRNTYTPTFTNISATVNFVRYQKLWKMCTVWLKWTAGGAASGEISISLPFTAETNWPAGGLNSCGRAMAWDGGGLIGYGDVLIDTATTLKVRTGTNTWAATNPHTWANGNPSAMSFTYPLA